MQDHNLLGDLIRYDNCEEDKEEEIEFVEKNHPNTNYDDDFEISCEEDGA